MLNRVFSISEKVDLPGSVTKPFNYHHCIHASFVWQHTVISGFHVQKTYFDDRAFAVAGPASWNRLPATIRSSDTLYNFTNQL